VKPTPSRTGVLNWEGGISLWWEIVASHGGGGKFKGDSGYDN